MKISVVRFSEHIMIGSQLEPRNALVDCRTDPNAGYVFGQVKLSKYDETFLRIDMYRNGELTQSQLVPWASVATVMFTEE